MGQKYSIPDLKSLQKLPLNESKDFQVFSISFRSRSQIYVLGCPHELVSKLEQSITKHYKEGCHMTTAWGGAHVFALNGRPFEQKLNKLQSRNIMRLLCAMMACIQAEGWQFVTNVDLCYWKTQRTMLFRRNKYSRFHVGFYVAKFQGLRIFTVSTRENSIVYSGQTLKVQCSQQDWFTKQFSQAESTFDNTLAVNIRSSKSSKLDVINAHPDIIDVIREAIGENQVVKQTSIEGDDADVTFVVHGNVWSAEEAHLFGYKSAMRGRSVLLDVFRKLDAIGYQLIAAATATASGDSLFFQKSAQSPPTQGNIGPRFGLMSVNKSDRLRLLGLTSEVSQAIYNVAKDNWTKGLHGDRPKHDREFYCDEIRFEGSPWECKDDIETKQSRYMMLKVFEQLSVLGWGVECGINITPWTVDDASVLVLRSCDKAKRAHFAIHPMAADQLWVIGAEKYVLDAIRNCIKLHAPEAADGIKEEDDQPNQTTVFKFESVEPWGQAYWVQSRHLLAHIVAALDKIHWRLAFSADCSIITSRVKHGDVEHKEEMDTIFFLKG